MYRHPTRMLRCIYVSTCSVTVDTKGEEKNYVCIIVSTVGKDIVIHSYRKYTISSFILFYNFRSCHIKSNLNHHPPRRLVLVAKESES